MSAHESANHFCQAVGKSRAVYILVSPKLGTIVDYPVGRNHTDAGVCAPDIDSYGCYHESIDRSVFDSVEPNL